MASTCRASAASNASRRIPLEDALPGGRGGVGSGMDASSLTADAPLPDDVPTLQALLRQVLAEMARLRAENAELRGKLDAALKHRFGRRSERQPRPRREDRP